VDAIAASAAAYGHAGSFLGTELTTGDVKALTNDANRLPHALLEACRRALARRSAEAIVIGGGPLAVAARAIAGELPVPIIEPVPAAVRLALSRARQEVA
jgi:Asp/Glu/hydantoin racemase